VVCGLALGALGAVAWVVAVAASAPNLSDLKPRDPKPLSEVFASDGTLLGYIHADTVFQSVPDNRIPGTLRDATVAIEDRRFFQHGALDYQGIIRAGVKDLFGSGNSLQGASTLTMQLVDNKYMPTDIAAHHNLKYKIIQAKLAEQLEKHERKPAILTNYLNDVPYGTVGGQTAVGIGAASEIFFNKPVWKLDLAQQALLAGLPQAPSEYNPFIDTGRARKRRRDVLEAMVKSRYITQEEADAAASEPLGVQTTGQYNLHREAFVFDYVQQQLIERFGLKTVEHGGLKVYTTIDLQKQQQARSALLSHEGGAGNPAAALATVDPSNGHVLALASTADYNQTKFNYAANGHRQPGSSFKVFVLMTLIHHEDGDPNQTYYNSHFLPAGWLQGYPTYSVHTAEDTYQGNINVTKATIVSDNTVFAQLDADLGPENVRNTAYAMGITTHLDALPAEAIGGLRIGVTPLEMADAYATLANGGFHVPATVLDKVVFPDGSTANLGDPPHKRVFSDGEAAAAIKILKGVIASGTGTAAGYGCPAAGKTGTTNDLSNAWFVGFTPKLSTAVWVGYPSANIAMSNGFGGALAAPIWHDYMASASGGYCGDFPSPSNPWSGTAYFGSYGTTGNTKPVPGSGPRSGSGNSGSGSGGGSGGSAYNNPALYAQPPQPPAQPPPVSNGGSGTGLPPQHGNGNGGGGKRR
jgi:penicillin-binding protein 1A